MGNIQLEGLRYLFSSMKEKGIKRYRFEYKHGRAAFDVFFFIDEEPFILLFGAKGDNFSFEIQVNSGFMVKNYLDREVYGKLCEILGLKYNPDNRFSPEAFFNSFNQKIPDDARKSSTAQSHEIAKYRTITEEADKIYFLGWRHNDLRTEHVSGANLQKTKLLLGTRAYKRCKSKNISSCWTDSPNKAKTFKLPE